MENIARALVESHHQYCVWKFMIIPESIVQLTDIYSNETINRFLRDAEEFLLRIQSIEITGQTNTVAPLRSSSNRIDSFGVLGLSH